MLINAIHRLKNCGMALIGGNDYFGNCFGFWFAVALDLSSVRNGCSCWWGSFFWAQVCPSRGDCQLGWPLLFASAEGVGIQTTEIVKMNGRGVAREPRFNLSISPLSGLESYFYGSLLNQSPIKCVVWNVSKGGACILLNGSLEDVRVGDKCRLASYAPFEQEEYYWYCSVRWIKFEVFATFLGISFESPDQKRNSFFAKFKQIDIWRLCEVFWILVALRRIALISCLWWLIFCGIDWLEYGFCLEWLQYPSSWKVHLCLWKSMRLQACVDWRLVFVLLWCCICVAGVNWVSLFYCSSYCFLGIWPW